MRSSRKYILSKLSQEVSWRVIFCNNEIFSIRTWCKSESNSLRSFPDYLCKMSCFRTKIRFCEIIKLNFIIPWLSSNTILVISWWRRPHVIKILSILSITVIHLSKGGQMLCPHLCILVKLFIDIKWRRIMFWSQLIMFKEFSLSKCLHVIIL